MKLNYKRLGNYIRQVDVRNRDLVVNKLLGLSIAKQFITSIANTTGTDMSTYKIVQPRQFGYVPVTSRNGDKITIALYEGESPCIISQAYIVFEVIDDKDNCILLNFKVFQQISYKNEVFFTLFVVIWHFYQWRAILCK